MEAHSDQSKLSNFHLGPPEDAFTEFISYAQSVLTPSDANEDDKEFQGPPWGWTCSQILNTCKSYSSGVTAAILLSELSQAWHEQRRLKNSKAKINPKLPASPRSKRGHRRLPKTVTIDSIYEKKFLALDAVLEAIVVDVYLLQGTSTYILCLGDPWSSNTIEHYLHRKFYDLVDPNHGVLRRGREIRLTGCHLRISQTAGHSRLLPTEHFLVILDEEQDDDFMLLGAQFCSDSFSSISDEAVEAGNEYCLYARAERIQSIEVEGERQHSNHSKSQKLTLADTSGLNLELVLWDEQVLLSNLFSQGSWLALDKPCVERGFFHSSETNSGFYLTCGRGTRLYCVPYVCQEEQVTVTPSQALTQLPRSTCTPKRSVLDSETQEVRISQIVVPCDSQGSLDFSNFPFRLFSIDLRNKMSNVSLYGTVTVVARLDSDRSNTFFMEIQDSTGSVRVKLYFDNSWSLGNICSGHTIFLSGLSCFENSEGRLECMWHEGKDGVCLYSISSQLALLNSPCLHHVSSLSELNYEANVTQVCRVLIECIEIQKLVIELSHSKCGYSVSKEQNDYPFCSFCGFISDAEVSSSFSVTVIIQDDSTKVHAYCSGLSAAELLQVLPDEFSSWHEVDQAMYLISIQNEEFIVSICKYISDFDSKAHDSSSRLTIPAWRIVRALKYD